MKKNYSREKEWLHRLNIAVAGLLLFETLTGLSIYFLPFSINNQVQVLLHTGIGFVFIIPFIIYSVRHWNVYTRMPNSHFKITGYAMLLIMLVLIISGVVVSWQAIFGTKSRPR